MEYRTKTEQEIMGGTLTCVISGPNQDKFYTPLS